MAAIGSLPRLLPSSVQDQAIVANNVNLNGKAVDPGEVISGTGADTQLA
jgi:hypothetical protein